MFNSRQSGEHKQDRELSKIIPTLFYGQSIESLKESTMKKRFIALIDLSPHSEHLLRFAYDWSKRVGAEMLLVHEAAALVPLMTPYETKIELIDIANREARHKLKGLSDAILPRGNRVKLHISEKSLVITIRKLLEEPFDNLVFIGIKRTGLVKKILIGSQAVKVINDIDNLIVAVPEKASCCTPDAIHVAVHKNYPLNIFELNKFLRFIFKDIKRIKFFSVITPEDDRAATEKYLKELIELYSDKYDASYEQYTGLNTLKELKKILLEKGNEFIVVQRGARILLDQIFRKFLINELVYEGNTPLIILP